MVVLKSDDGTPYRAFVCQHINPWGFYPAKDRSGRLEVVEGTSGPPHFQDHRAAPLLNGRVFMNSYNHNAAWNDFNVPRTSANTRLIRKTLVKVIMAIRPGGYDDPSQGMDRRLCDPFWQTGAILPQCQVHHSGHAQTGGVRSDWPVSRRAQVDQHRPRSFLRAILNSGTWHPSGRQLAAGAECAPYQGVCRSGWRGVRRSHRC